MFTTSPLPRRFFHVTLLCSVLALNGSLFAQATGQQQNLLNGSRVMREGDQNVYLVIDGRRHLIPDPRTYLRLFKNWEGIRRDTQAFRSLREGEPLSNQAMLAKTANSEVVYLLDGMRRKHPIGSIDVFNQMGFDLNNIVVFPPDLLNPVPTASAIE